MADPVTWIAIGTAVLGAGAAVYEGQVASANAKAQANAEEYNAVVATNAARDANLQAGSREEAARRHARQILGKQRAAIAESGAGFGGTYAGVIDQSAANAELDALNARYQGDIESRGLLAQAEQARYGARVSRMNAKSARTAGYINAGAAALSAGSGYYSGQARVAGAGKG